MRSSVVFIFAALMRLLIAKDANAAPTDDSLGKSARELRRALQLIVVTAADWDTPVAQITCYERKSGNARWALAFAPSPAVVGTRGLAWGIGIDDWMRTAGGGKKEEGDKRAPAGVFRLHEIFGYLPAQKAKITTFAYRELTEGSEGVDDSKSHYYNRIVDQMPARDWAHAEKMRRNDDLYRWGVVVEHNWDAIPGRGSCIFLHIWNGAGRGTAGCTAMPAALIERLVRWLDRDRHPLLVQLPRDELTRLKQGLRLP